MAKTICALHGPQIGPLACHHIKSSIAEQRAFIVTACVKFGVPDFEFSHYFCRECAVRWHIRDGTQLLSEDMSETYRDALESTLPVCGVCFRNLFTESDEDHTADTD